MQISGEVPESFGAEIGLGAEGSGIDAEVRFRKVPVQMRRLGSDRFRWRFRKVARFGIEV